MIKQLFNSVFYLSAISIILINCKSTGIGSEKPDVETTVQIKKQRPSALNQGKFLQSGKSRLLYGGEDSAWHFNISNMELTDSQFHYGIGRERFEALLSPQFITEQEANAIYYDRDRFLLFTLGEEARAYGIDLLTRHEVVNDVVDGEPVAAAYCILADLGAMYSRRVGDTVLTFALSGYTYYDPGVWNGLDGFVWWDRETESLWWPLTGKGEAGPLKDVPMTVYDESQWSQTTWASIRGKYENLKVLKPDQHMEVPASWTKFGSAGIAAAKRDKRRTKVAPKWGEND